MQRWENFDVVNDSEFGKRLQSFAKRNLSLMVDSKWECGWSDGGCRIFAEALVEWSQGGLELKAIMHEHGGVWSADHVLASFISPLGNVLFLDAEGVADKNSLLSRWEDMEDRYGCVIGDFVADEKEPPPKDAAISSLVAGKLAKRFGKFSDLLLIEPENVFLGMSRRPKRSMRWN